MFEVLLFRRPDCVKCDILAKDMENSGIYFEEVDVSTPDGLAEAVYYEKVDVPFVVIRKMSRDVVIVDPEVEDIEAELGSI